MRKDSNVTGSDVSAALYAALACLTLLSVLLAGALYSFTLRNEIVSTLTTRMSMLLLGLGGVAVSLRLAYWYIELLSPEIGLGVVSPFRQIYAKACEWKKAALGHYVVICVVGALLLKRVRHFE